MRTLIQLALSAIPLFLLACSDSKEEACGTGLVYQNGACVAASAGSGGSAGSAATTGGASSTSGGSSATGTFGTVCDVNEDCTEDTNYCAHSPVDPMPYCTASGCDTDPSVCPSGWTCFNVGQFAPGEPYICMKP